MKNFLYLVPSNLSDSYTSDSFSKEYLEIVFSLQHFIVENERTARRFLSKLGHPGPISNLTFCSIDKHASVEDQEAAFDFILEDHPTGLLSEAGCPGVADPGADLVDWAHQSGIKVVPLIGPSSLVLALMGSGLNGQNFCFNGYLDREDKERRAQLKTFEKESRNANRTQIFIETPYRNQTLFQCMLKTLHPETRLTLACELTHPDGWIKTRTIEEWKEKNPGINKKNTVFLFLAS